MENKDYEFVHHPEHYQSERGECIDCMREDLGDEVALHFCQGNAYKYRFRAGDKPGESTERDLGKAENYDRMEEEINKDYHDGWNRCCDGKFPEDGQEVNITIEDAYGERRVWPAGYYKANSKVGLWIGNRGVISEEFVTVIAWMPLPEPYREGGE